MYILYTYQGLLDDVAFLSKFSEIRGLEYTLQWCLTEAPKLEKQMLGYLESARIEPGPELDALVALHPKQLRRLAAGSVTDPVLLRYYRQLMLFAYKASVPHDPTTIDAAYSSYVTCSSEVGEFPFTETPLLRLARKHVHSVLHRVNWKDIKPSHGPGSVTTSKTRWQRWHPELDAVYPYFPYMLLGNEEHLAEMPEIQEEIVAKVTAVPKDSRGPRLICVHPAEAIWIQQGTRRVLESAIVRRRPRSQGYPWPCGHVNFDDQSINGRIAMASSKSRRYATLDLKEASDRLSVPLVSYLFGSHYKYLACSRAQSYVIPGKGRFKMTSFAPMGNANVFPVQSIVFWAICVASLQLSSRKTNSGAVFVFGDDIIVPSSHVGKVQEDLTSVGLVVNSSKSFSKGYFRESCGVDAYKGVNVTPIRWKTCANPNALVDLLALCDTAMRLRIAGYHDASVRAYCIVRRVLFECYGKELLKTNNPDHGALLEYVQCDSHAFSDAKWHRDWQWFFTPSLHVEPVAPRGHTGSSWNCVLESLTSLQRCGAGRRRSELAPQRVKLTCGWTRVL